MDEHGERRATGMGRRESDPPGVPLREHLETLIRGVQIRFEHDTAELARAVREGNDECRADFEDLRKSVHRLKGDISGLAKLEAQREGARLAHRDTQEWLKWVPTVLSLVIAGYVAFGA